MTKQWIVAFVTGICLIRHARLQENYSPVPGDPVITGQKSVVEGNNITLTCTSIGGDPAPTVIWLRGGNPVDKSYTTTNGVTTNSLTFIADISHHLSVYECQVYNSVLNDPFSSTCNLEVYTEPNTPTLTGPTNLTLGIKRQWTCVSSGGIPAPILSFRIGNTTLTSGVNYANAGLQSDRTYTVTGILTWAPSLSNNGDTLYCDVSHQETRGNNTQTAQLQLSVVANEDIDQSSDGLVDDSVANKDIDQSEWDSETQVHDSVANADSTISTVDFNPLMICPQQSLESFTFSVKSCKNVKVAIYFSYVVVVVNIGQDNYFSSICRISEPQTPLCLPDVQTKGIFDCNTFRQFNITWNSTGIYLWNVDSGQNNLVLNYQRSYTNVKAILLNTFSGNRVTWRFNTTEWNISPDLSCDDSTRDFGSAVIITDNTGSTSNSNLIETDVIKATQIRSTTGSSDTDQDPLPTPIGSSNESSRTDQDQSSKTIGSADGSSGRDQDPSPTSIRSNDVRTDTYQVTSPTSIGSIDGRTGTDQDTSPTSIGSTDGRTGTVQDTSPTSIGSIDGRTGTDQDTSPTSIGSTDGRTGTVQDTSTTSIGSSDGSLGTYQDPSTTTVGFTDGSSGTDQDLLQTTIGSTDEILIEEQDPSSTTLVSFDGSSDTDQDLSQTTIGSTDGGSGINQDPSQTPIVSTDRSSGTEQDPSQTIMASTDGGSGIDQDTTQTTIASTYGSSGAEQVPSQITVKSTDEISAEEQDPSSTIIASTDGTSGTDQDPLSNSIMYTDGSLGTDQDPAQTSIGSTDGILAEDQDPSQTTKTSTDGSSVADQNPSQTTIVYTDGSPGTDQRPSSTTERSTDGSSAEERDPSQTTMMSTDGSPGTDQDPSQTTIVYTEGSPGTEQDPSQTTIVYTEGSPVTEQDPSQTSIGSTDGSTGTNQDPSQTSIGSTDGSTGTNQDPSQTIMASTDGGSRIDQDTTQNANLETSSLASDHRSQTTQLPYLDILKCRCPCTAISEHNPFMYFLGRNLSTEELIEQMRWRLDEIKSSLLINKTDTTKYKSKKISVNDNRASSSAIGWFSGIVIATVVLVIIAFDLLRVRQLFTKIKTTAATV